MDLSKKAFKALQKEAKLKEKHEASLKRSHERYVIERVKKLDKVRILLKEPKYEGGPPKCPTCNSLLINESMVEKSKHYEYFYCNRCSYEYGRVFEGGLSNPMFP